MTHEDFMRLAIEVATQSEQEGGIAIGAVLVKDGKVVSTGKSLVSQMHDPSAHGEINCIRGACKEFQRGDLDGCIMYGTLEPCGMCLACASWANLSEIYFGAYRIDVPENAYEQKDWSAEVSASNYKLWDGRPMKVTGGILREECIELFKGYKNWHKVI